MTLQRSLRLWLQKSARIDLQRYPRADPLWPVFQTINSLNVSHVVDVGANSGEYSANLRRLGYGGSITSLEPIASAFSRLRETARGDRNWNTVRVALGEAVGQATINVAGNNAASSSFLPMLDAHRVAAPEVDYVGTETVPITTLDNLWRERRWDLTRGSFFLKLDVQGFERAVLTGAAETLRNRQLVAIQLETSFRQLYQDSWLYSEALEFLSNHGFAFHCLIPGFTDLKNGALMQADLVVTRA